MKIFLTVLSLFILSSSLDAYSKKIVIGSFQSKKNAKKLLKKLPKVILQYKELKELLKAEGSTIHVRKVGSYHLVLAEMFTDEKVAKESLKIIKFFFKNAYMNDAPSEKDLLEKANAIAKLKEEIELLKKQKLEKDMIQEIPLSEIKEEKATFLSRIEKVYDEPKIEKVYEEPTNIKVKQENSDEDFLKSIDFKVLGIFILLMSLVYFIVDKREKKQLRIKE